MTTAERVRAWARNEIPMDITTGILRGEGMSNEEIRAAYEAVWADPASSMLIEKGNPTLVFDTGW